MVTTLLSPQRQSVVPDVSMLQDFIHFLLNDQDQITAGAMEGF